MSPRYYFIITSGRWGYVARKASESFDDTEAGNGEEYWGKIPTELVQAVEGREDAEGDIGRDESTETGNGIHVASCWRWCWDQLIGRGK